MKSVTIEAWRFFFAIYMMVYHIAFHIYGIRTGGYIGVDAFFIISGYFMALTQMEKDAPPLQYLKGRITRLYPIYIASYCIAELIRTLKYFERDGLEFLPSRIYESFPEMFMLDIKTTVNGPSWFVAAMLIAGFVLYAIMSIDKNHAIKTLVFPVLSVFIYSQFNDVFGKIHAHNSQKIFPPVYDGIVRAFAGMALGAFAYVVVKAIKEKGVSKKWADVFTFVGNVCFAAVILLSINYYHGFMDFWYLFLIFAAVILINIGTEAKKSADMSTTEKVVVYLGGLAYPMYLLHDSMYNLFRTFKLIEEPFAGCVIIILIVIAEAALVTFGINKLAKLIKSKKTANAEKSA